MPPAKRPLSEADPNAAARSSGTRRKAPKLQEKQSKGPVQQEKKRKNNENANNSSAEPEITHKLFKVHSEDPIDVSIAERFQNRSYMMRSIKTYNDLQISELKELLAERALRISGKKSDLVSRLVQWDDEHPSGEKKVGDDHKEALARQPVPIGAKASEMGPKKEHPVETIRRRGPEGPPVYDELGFELDYKKCIGGPTRKDAIVRNMEKAVDRRISEREIKARIMGVAATKDLHYLAESLWNDRVSKDLNIPFHKVTAAKFEEWQKKGFKANPGDFDVDKITTLEEERLMFLQTGSALRK